MEAQNLLYRVLVVCHLLEFLGKWRKSKLSTESSNCVIHLQQWAAEWPQKKKLYSVSYIPPEAKRPLWQPTVEISPKNLNQNHNKTSKEPYVCTPHHARNKDSPAWMNWAHGRWRKVRMIFNGHGFLDMILTNVFIHMLYC